MNRLVRSSDSPRPCLTLPPNWRKGVMVIFSRKLDSENYCLNSAAPPWPSRHGWQNELELSCEIGGECSDKQPSIEPITSLVYAPIQNWRTAICARHGSVDFPRDRRDATRVLSIYDRMILSLASLNFVDIGRDLWFLLGLSVWHKL